jgi:hypothetical protein
VKNRAAWRMIAARPEGPVFPAADRFSD